MSHRSSTKAAPGRPQPADQAEGKKASRTNPSKKAATSSAARVDAGTRSEAGTVRPESKPSTSHVSPARGASCPVPRQSSLPTSESTSRYSRSAQSFDQGKHHRKTEQTRSHSFHWHPRVRANVW